MELQSNKIASAKMEFLNGKIVDLAKYVNLPITWESVLDETHGTATVLLTDMRQADFEPYGVSVEKPFTPNTPLEIRFEGQKTKIRMIVARDTAEMARKDGFPTWSHRLELVDEVKLLEQEPVDNLTFKNPVARKFETNSNTDWFGNDTFSNGWIPPQIKSVLNHKGLLQISDNASLFNVENNTGSFYYELQEITLTVLCPNGKKNTVISKPQRSDNIVNAPYLNSIFLIDFNTNGEYFLEFNIKFSSLLIQENYLPDYKKYKHVRSAYVFVGDNSEDLYKPFTIKSVLDRLLDVTPTRTAGQESKYHFKDNAEAYATEESPEFTFTGKHLFEALLDIASYKKMFPALERNEVYFRPFYSGKTLYSEDLPPPDKAVLNSTIDQYCNALDSYVENLVCINDSNVGTVVEPYASGYISGRSGSGASITESTAVAPTLSPIYQVQGLEVFANGIDVGDIQAYLYESEDYEALSDTSATYPYSKAYAIKYTRFANNFVELSHRIEASNSVAAAFRRPALANVVGAVSDATVGIGLQEYLSQYVSEKSKASAFAEVLYRPTYTPVVNARVRQYKPYMDAETPNATLFYNQQAEVVDSEAFGEHIKGLVQKLGNNTEVRVYTFRSIDQVPKVGDVLDGKSVYNVSVTVYETQVTATICLVEYAELSKFIGVKNEIKTSDISTTKWAKRFVNWEEFFVFTHNANAESNALSVTETAITKAFTFTEATPLTCAEFSTYTEEGDKIATVLAPIKHLALGNSIYFQFETLDNFAVGYQSELAPEGATSVLTGTRYDRAQKAVRYCDALGRAETVSFKLSQDGANPSNSTYVFTEDDIAEINANGEAKTLTVKLKKAYPVYLRVTVQDNAGGMYICNLIPNQTDYTTTLIDGDTDVSLFSIGFDNRDEAKKKVNQAFIRSEIAHAYPKKHERIEYINPTSETTPVFELNDLLVKKNSAECLKLACQYHFRQEIGQNFFIGSGMSNFSSLIGGACEEVKLLVSALPINPFDRHINKSLIGLTLKELGVLPQVGFDSWTKNLRIILPEAINDKVTNALGSSYTPKAWLLVGEDKNGNWQIICGENKKGNEAFNRYLYLVARKK